MGRELTRLIYGITNQGKVVRDFRLKDQILSLRKNKASRTKNKEPGTRNQEQNSPRFIIHPSSFIFSSPPAL